MPILRKTLGNRSGQALMIALGLGMLLLIGLTSMVFVNQTGALHQFSSAQGTKGASVAEEGINFAEQELGASSTTWTHALSGNFADTDCNTGNAVATPSGSSFKLYCSVGTAANPNLQTYEVSVTAVALGSANQNKTPVRAIQAYLSRRTIGADLSNSLHAPAALLVVKQPVVSGILNVHWGPVVCLDANNMTPWSLPELADSQRYPRKFSIGGITNGLNSTYARSGSSLGAGLNTDQKEYWAWAPISPPPLIDEASYISLAQNESNITAASLPATNCATSNCGYFQPPNGGTVFFGSGYTVPAGNPVIYVNGNAEFDDIAINGATFIVTQQLTIKTSATANTLNLHVPWTAPSEYPYAPTTPATWPCQGQQGHADAGGLPLYDCASAQVFSGSVQFRGFLYVKGNLYVGNATLAANWNMVGTLMVGDLQAIAGASGQLNIPNTASALNLAYDDQINAGILVNPIFGTQIRIVPDLEKNVAPY